MRLHGAGIYKFGSKIVCIYVHCLCLSNTFYVCSMKKWFHFARSGSLGEEYHLHGAPSQEVARLLFADFPTSMLVYGLFDTPAGYYKFCKSSK